MLHDIYADGRFEISISHGNITQVVTIPKVVMEGLQTESSAAAKILFDLLVLPATLNVYKEYKKEKN